MSKYNTDVPAIFFDRENNKRIVKYFKGYQSQFHSKLYVIRDEFNSFYEIIDINTGLSLLVRKTIKELRRDFIDYNLLEKYKSFIKTDVYKRQVKKLKELLILKYDSEGE